MAAEDVALEQATFEITQTHQSLIHARHLVDELHQTVRSASYYLDETELDAAKAQLAEPDRRDRFMEAALDRLSGLKENVIIGKLIPASTGLREYRAIEISPRDGYGAPLPAATDDDYAAIAAELGVSDDDHVPLEGLEADTDADS